MHRSLALVSFTVLLASAGCAAPEAEVDDLAATDTDLGELGAADAAGGLYTYYSLRHDFRRCIYPLCGGYWVSRVNRASTVCADGRSAAECYVADVDLVALGLSDEEAAEARGGLGRAIVRGSIESRSIGEHPAPALVASEVWIAPTDFVADGVFVRIEDDGIRCITSPCSSLSEDKLNSSLGATIAAIDFSPSGATDAEIAAAYDGLAEDGLIVAGYRYTVRGPGGRAKGRTATAFYVRVRHDEAAAGCMATGCSGQICSDTDVLTTCEWRESYACYHAATCERQADGRCGWTSTPELVDCLSASGI